MRRRHALLLALAGILVLGAGCLSDDADDTDQGGGGSPGGAGDDDDTTSQMDADGAVEDMRPAQGPPSGDS